ncbi:hypothetical protein PUN28_003972 [Cardiocondyla obscurior]|uniref:Uncharacterized protein n=1 Tax=Cardiocondyla obscurior TaxID=286306 RepID=A0AAW2GMR7_9HYME
MTSKYCLIAFEKEKGLQISTWASAALASPHRQRSCVPNYRPKLSPADATIGIRHTAARSGVRDRSSGSRLVLVRQFVRAQG